MYAEAININRQRRIYVVTIALSLVLHFLFLFIFDFDFMLIDWGAESDEVPQPVTVVFPENIPRRIVENINETDEIPERADLLSDRNSRAMNPELFDVTTDQPASQGNIPYENLTLPNQAEQSSNLLPAKKFSRDALISDQGSARQENFFSRKEENYRPNQLTQRNQETTDNKFDQRKFSADQLGSLTLSTYAWEWAPYINAMKRKLYQVWFAPPAYSQLGLIHGQTTIQYSISRDGDLIEYNVLQHVGHASLKQSSINAIESLFPFKTLPVNFPDEKLTIRATLIYPNLRERMR